MAWTIEYDPRAIKDLNTLDRSVRAEPLRHDKFGLWRYRVRDFRIVCELQEARRVVLVVTAGHRKNVYG